MNEDTVQKLLDLNSRFYQSFGAAFAETRRRIQPGVQRIAEQYVRGGDWLDLGCGSGALGQRLATSGMGGSYLGLDFSRALLSEAKKGAESQPEHPGFALDYGQADLLDSHWPNVVGDKVFDGVLAFAVFHHLPGAEHRLRIVKQIAGLIKPGGVFIHSEWMFHNSPKLLARVQPWSLAGLDEAELEPGDTLLDWRHQAQGQADGPGLRYVHLFSRAELAFTAGQAGFSIIEEFESDGKEGNLALYQVWKKA